MYGYSGNILKVDLTQEKSSTEVLRTELVRKYVGGVGLAVKLAYDNSKPNVDPFSPENVLVLTTGPMSGIMTPTGSGHVFAGKSPLTGCLGVSVTQGFFGSSMKRAGYDAIVFKGKSRSATCVWIDDDSVEFRDVRGLWGKSPERTEETLRDDLGDSSIRVASIGLAGELLSRIASIVSDHTRVSGRSGLGAVMGSKNLKAIAIRGSHDMEVANAPALVEFCREYYLRARASSATKYFKGESEARFTSVKDRQWVMSHETTTKYRDAGTPSDILVFNSEGCLPTKNFGADTFSGAENISGECLNELYVTKVQACSSCSISCEHIATVPEGTYKDATANVDYGSVWAFGPQCGVESLDAVVKAIELCNSYGLDAVSTGNVIGFAMDCYEKGILSYADAGDLDLRFGNYKAMLELIRRIGSREGFGDILAEGVRRAARKIDKGSEEFAFNIKGLEMGGYDVSCSNAAALNAAVQSYEIDPDSFGGHAFEFARTSKSREIAKIVSDTQDLYSIFDSLLVCKALIGVYEGFGDLARLYNLVTGMSVTANELKAVGERIHNLARLFNVREGITCQDDRLPEKFLSIEPHEDAHKDHTIAEREFASILALYYECRGWTKEGVPTDAKLRELGI